MSSSRGMISCVARPVTFRALIVVGRAVAAHANTSIAAMGQGPGGRGLLHLPQNLTAQFLIRAAHMLNLFTSDPEIVTPGPGDMGKIGP